MYETVSYAYILFMVIDYILYHGYDGKHVLLLTGNSCSSAAEKQNILLHKEPVRAAKGDSLIPVYQFVPFLLWPCYTKFNHRFAGKYGSQQESSEIDEETWRSSMWQE